MHREVQFSWKNVFFVSRLRAQGQWFKARGGDMVALRWKAGSWDVVAHGMDGGCVKFD